MKVASAGYYCARQATYGKPLQGDIVAPKRMPQVEVADAVAQHDWNIGTIRNDQETSRNLEKE